MARYGSFMYDTGAGAEHYGVTVGGDTLAWGIEIDWDGDGYFTGTPEAYPIDLKTERGRQFAIKSDGSGFEPVATGRLTVKLDNSDGRYDPFNGASPLFPNVAPGKKIVVRVRDVGDASGTVYFLFTGEVVDIKPDSGNTQVSITAVESQKLLTEVAPKVSIGVTADVDTVIVNILNAAGWTYGMSIDTGSDSIPYFWATAANVWLLLQEITDVFLGKLFIAANGSVKYYSRNKLFTPVVALTENDVQQEIVVHQPWEIIRNKILWTVTARTLQALSVVWTLSSEVALAVGASATYEVTYQYSSKNCPCSGMIPPVPTTDYTANASSGGGGADRTSSLNVAANFFGDRAEVVVTNIGVDTLYITLLQLRGYPITAKDAVVVKATDTSSIALYHERELKLSSLLQQDINSGVTYSAALLLEYSTAKKWPEIRMVARWNKQFLPDLFDAITLTFPTIGVSGDFWATRILHEWQNSTGQDVRTTIQTEPVAAYNTGWVFPTTFNVDSVLGL